MAARQKLNQAHLTGSLLLAGLVGWIASSWLVFVIAVIVLVGMNFHTDEIRLRRRKR